MPLFGLFGPPNVEKLKAKGDVKGLIRALEYYENAPRMREAAAQALSELKDTRAVEPLLAVLEGRESGFAAEAAAQVLGELGDPRALEPLIAALRYRTFGLNLVRAATEALVKIGSASVEPLIVALGDSNEQVREAAAKALGGLKDARATEPLVAALFDNDYGVREAVAEALGELKDARAVEPLLAKLRDEHGGVEWAAAKALKQIGSKQAVEPLIELLRDNDADKRSWAENILENIDPSEAKRSSVAPFVAIARHNWSQAVSLGSDAIEPLAAALHYSDAETRLGAIKALGEIRAKQAVEPLVAALLDIDSRIRQTAIQALGQIGDSRAIEPLLALLQEGSYFVDSDILGEALGRLADERVIEVLLESLHEKGIRRYVAIKALGQAGKVQTLAPLVEMCRDTEFSEEVAKMIKEALEKILEHSADKATNEDLQAVITLQNVRYLWDYPSGCDLGPIDMHLKIEIDHIKQLARQELIRRGEEA